MGIAETPGRFEVECGSYLQLLVDANKTDPADWPGSYEHGAKLLSHIREIERGRVVQHGKWDVDALGRELETEYEGCIAQLEDLVDPPDYESLIPAEEVYAELGLLPAAA